MKKQVAHIGIGFAALAAFAALVLAGCVPGEAQIKVKSSELAKMAKGEIGWADVTIVASNVYPNVTMDVFPERARNLKPPKTYAQPGHGEFSVTNRLSDALAFMVERLNDALPYFFCISSFRPAPPSLQTISPTAASTAITAGRFSCMTKTARFSMAGTYIIDRLSAASSCQTSWLLT